MSFVKKRLNIIAFLFVITFILSFFVGLIFQYGRPYEIASTSNDWFIDFTAPLAAARAPYSELGFGRGYLPFLYLALWPFTFFSENVGIILALVLFVVFFYITSFLFLERKLERLCYCLVLCSFSYPFIFLLDRANTEMFMYMYIALFMLVYFDKNNFLSPLQKDVFSALFLSFAVCSKLFPLVFIILFFRDKKYRCFGFTILFSVIITWLGFIVLNGSINDIVNNNQWFDAEYGRAVFKMVGPQHTHSI